jgi:hypothetical protein
VELRLGFVFVISSVSFFSCFTVIYDRLGIVLFMA